jgi:hypothetical protein
MQSDINPDIDITAITIELNELRSKFDQGMRDDRDFWELKQTYLHMKELECHLKALQWGPEKTAYGRPAPAAYARS